jgi:hypothetical protein
MYYVWYEYKHGHLPGSIIVPGIGRVRVGGADNINNDDNINNNNNDTRVVT